MEPAVTCGARVGRCGSWKNAWQAVIPVLMWLLPVAAHAQETAPPSRVWIVAGPAAGTVHGDCQECEEPFPYHHAVGLVANGGYRVTRRMDVGIDVFWMPFETITGRIQGVHVDAVAQFRPWGSRGLFVKGGAGMAFIRNWAEVTSIDPINSKALSVLIGGGWEFRRAGRLGFQLFAEQHVAALGDLQLGSTALADVTGNSWALGAAIVIR
jgi:hypothetical protein